jgi:hypothetical protein
MRKKKMTVIHHASGVLNKEEYVYNVNSRPVNHHHRIEMNAKKNVEMNVR